MNKIKKWIVPLVAVVLLTACSKDGGSVATLSKGGNAPQTEMQAPTPLPQAEPQYIEVTRETTRNVPVEVTRIVKDVQYIEVTPAPQIQGFDAQAPVRSGVVGYSDSSTCDTAQPQESPRAGGVDRVVGCVGEWNKAYEGGK